MHAPSALLVRLDLGAEARAAAACHFSALLARLDLGAEVRAAAGCYSGSLLADVDLGWRCVLRQRSIPVPPSLVLFWDQDGSFPREGHRGRSGVEWGFCFTTRRRLHLRQDTSGVSVSSDLKPHQNVHSTLINSRCQYYLI